MADAIEAVTKNIKREINDKNEGYVSTPPAKKRADYNLEAALLHQDPSHYHGYLHCVLADA